MNFLDMFGLYIGYGRFKLYFNKSDRSDLLNDIILYHEVPPLLSQHMSDVISTCANEINRRLIMNKLYLNKKKSELFNVPAHTPIYFFQ